MALPRYTVTSRCSTDFSGYSCLSFSADPRKHLRIREPINLSFVLSVNLDFHKIEPLRGELVSFLLFQCHTAAFLSQSDSSCWKFPVSHKLINSLSLDSTLLSSQDIGKMKQDSWPKYPCMPLPAKISTESLSLRRPHRPGCHCLCFL